eukprot:TRINITY_DN3716_c0_g1_i1.p2 TRINITY_DN3716_c0_g1~~TRINITY_DN3716_c0_g1_i1.p2  ORF type:complete len:192 (+),score=33.10 TRINITY_DN3716_c0_g1_i1:482-1057(+)
MKREAQDTVQWFELDLPEVMHYRNEVLRKTHTSGKRIHQVASDLSSPEWVDKLTSAGLNTRESAVWVVEGLLMYLPQAGVSDLLKRVRGLAAPGSTICGDILNESHFSSPYTQPLLAVWKQWAAPPVSGYDHPEELLSASGFTAPCVKQLGADGTDYGVVGAEFLAFVAGNPRPQQGPDPMPRNLLFHAVV